VGGREPHSILKAFLKGHLIPGKQIQRTQVISHCQRVELMQAWYYLMVFDVRQSADVQNEFRSPAAGRKFVADAFHIPIS